MGTILSPFPYDPAARDASQSAKLRHPTTLHYASRAAAFCGVVRLPLDSDPLDQSRDRRDVPNLKFASECPKRDLTSGRSRRAVHCGKRVLTLFCQSTAWRPI